MSDNVIAFGGRGPSGGGPEDPMLEARVGRLERDVHEMRADLRDVRDRVGRIEERLARMEGGFAAINAKLDALPTVWTFAVAIVGSVTASVAVALAVARLALAG